MLQSGFIILTIVLAIILFAGCSIIAEKTFTDIQKQRQFKIKAAMLLTGWLGYISIMSLKGVFTNLSLPPRIPLLLVAPAFIFMTWFFTSSGNKKIIESTPVSWLVYLQSFRVVVEILLCGLFVCGLLPKAGTFEGYNFDILIGITAPVIAWFRFAKNKINNTAFLIWNFAGLTTLAVVVFILISHAYFPALWHEKESILNKSLGIFPYTFLAGFLMPLAVFLHLFSIIKTTKNNKMSSPDPTA